MGLGVTVWKSSHDHEYTCNVIGIGHPALDEIAFCNVDARSACEQHRNVAIVAFTCLLRPIAVGYFALRVFDPCPNNPKIALD